MDKGQYEETMTPMCSSRLSIDIDRWHGVPIIVTAGKALMSVLPMCLHLQKWE